MKLKRTLSTQEAHMIITRLGLPNVGDVTTILASLKLRGLLKASVEYCGKVVWDAEKEDEGPKRFLPSFCVLGTLYDYGLLNKRKLENILDDEGKEGKQWDIKSVPEKKCNPELTL